MNYFPSFSVLGIYRGFLSQKGIFMNEETKNEIAIINEETLKNMIYEIRGEKVMFDFDLALVYGYSTKNFNRQVKNNMPKFEGFVFKLTSYEVNELLRCKNFTSNSAFKKTGRGGNRYHPYAFTEQGIYMLMTVLRGELAIKQSRALVIIFKKMKDYIKKEHNLIGTNNLVTLVDKYHELDKRVSITESKVDTLMDYFDDPTKYKEFAIKDNERIEADILFQNIYKEAKKSIIIIDDYISLKTLHLLKSSKEDVEITIISDNVARNRLEAEYLEDFKNDIGREISIFPSDHRFHDRYIVIDYKKDNEKLYHSGPSSKDAGNSITTITTLNDYEFYHQIISSIIGR